MLRRLGIRGKILVALTVPLLVVAVAAGLISYQSWLSATEAGEVAEVAALITPETAMITTLQNERAAALAVADGTADPGTLFGPRSNSDTAMAKLRVQLEGISDEMLGGSVADVRAEIEGLSQGLLDLRATTTADTSPAAVDSAYTQLALRVAALPTIIADATGETDLGPQMRALSDLLTADVALGHEAAVAEIALRDPQTNGNSVQQLTSLVPTTDLAIKAASADLDRIGASVPIVGPTDEEATARAAVGSGSETGIAAADVGVYDAYIDRQLDALVSAQRSLSGSIVADAEGAAAAANRELLLTAGIALLVVIVSSLVAWLVAQRIVVPMRRLIVAAGHVRDELPRMVEQVAIPGQAPDLSIADIPVTGRDEVGQLAQAFNEVNATTLKVAGEQAALRGSIAEMFVNVARRDQVLLNRQLTFIDALERSEEDPKVLADLFRLDHLATRMRRNAESLLVLAGIDTGRRLRETLPLSDVVRTASSEIEHYERVLLELSVDPVMLGHAALPTAHLIAELLENATLFSEPGTPVHVSTGRDKDHVIITVVDEGLGMSPQEIEAAHVKIRATSPSEVLGAQRLGFFVVGRIASRLGAQVQLSVGPKGVGTQATLRLPIGLFSDIASIPMAAPQLPPGAEELTLPEMMGEEPPDAMPVDLASMTDGTTEFGLPKRRTPTVADAGAGAPSTVGDAPYQPVFGAPTGAAGMPVGESLAAFDASAPATRRASSIPDAPAASALADAAATHGTSPESWSPTIQEGTPLTQRRPSRDPVAPPIAPLTAPTPTVPGAKAGGPASTAGAAGFGAVDERASMFSGFRSMRDVQPPNFEDRPAAEAQVPVADEPTTIFPAHDDVPVEVDQPFVFGSSASALLAEEPADEVVAFPEESAQTPAVEVQAASFAEETAPAPSFGVPEAPVPAWRTDEPSWRAVERELPPLGAREPLDEPAWRASARAAKAALQSSELPLDEPAWRASASDWYVSQMAGVSDQGAEPAAEDRAPQVAHEAEPMAVPQLEVPQFETPQFETPQFETPPDEPAWTIPPQAEPMVVPQLEADPDQGFPGAPSVLDDQNWAQMGPGESTDEPSAAEENWAAAPAQQESWAATALTRPEALGTPDEISATQEAPLSPVPPVQRVPAASELPVSSPETQQASWARATDEDFSALVRGSAPSTAAPPADEKPRRSRWPFGRKRKASDAAVTPAVPQAPSATPAFSPGAPMPAAPAPNDVAASQPTSWTSPEPTGWAPDVHEPQVDDARQTFADLAASSPQFKPEPEPEPEPPAFLPAPSAGPQVGGEAWSPAQTEEPWQPDSFAPAATPIWQAEPEPRAATSGNLGDSGQAGALPSETQVPSQHSFATFVPAGDVDAAAVMAQRAGIAQQALAELSQLSSYRPQELGASTQPLTRRTPTKIPQPAPTEAARRTTPRDATQVRSLLASFQSGTTRGRQQADTTETEGQRSSR